MTTEEARIIAETEARVVAWLRDVSKTQGGTYRAHVVADAIERGEHRKDQTNAGS